MGRYREELDADLLERHKPTAPYQSAVKDLFWALLEPARDIFDLIGETQLPGEAAADVRAPRALTSLQYRWL